MTKTERDKIIRVAREFDLHVFDLRIEMPRHPGMFSNVLALHFLTNEDAKDLAIDDRTEKSLFWCDPDDYDGAVMFLKGWIGRTLGDGAKIREMYDRLELWNRYEQRRIEDKKSRDELKNKAVTLDRQRAIDPPKKRRQSAR